MEPAKATMIPFNDECNLTIKVGRDGVWLNFLASNGRQASININVMSETKGGVVGSALYQWAIDREIQAKQIEADNGQFGVGA